MASLVPDPSLGGVHFVLCDFGRLGQAFVETDPARAAREDVVDDILSGELGQPLKVITLDADGTWRDVSADIASAVMCGAALAGHPLTRGATDFVTAHIGYVEHAIFN